MNLLRFTVAIAMITVPGHPAQSGSYESRTSFVVAANIDRVTVLRLAGVLSLTVFALAATATFQSRGGRRRCEEHANKNQD